MMTSTMRLLLLLCCSVVVAAWQPPSRRQWIASTFATTTASLVGASTAASAAPPIAIIAQELGYFPATNSDGDTVYIPKRVSRDSSDQAIALAEHLQKINAKVYETYWCPHSARQRELFGRQAWAIVDHIECSPKGYRANPKMCIAAKIDGYPTWKIKGKEVGGERPLAELAKASGFPGVFDESLEENLPRSLGSSECKQ